MTLDAAAPAIFFVALAAVAGLGARALQQGPINPISVYATVWSTLAVLAVVSLTDFNPMRQETWGLMFASGAALVLGSTHAWLLLASAARTRASRAVMVPMVYSERALRTAFLVGIASLLVYVGIQGTRLPVLSLLRSIGGLEGIVSGGGLEYRFAYVALNTKQAVNAFENAGLAVAILGYVLFVPGMLVILLAGQFALKRQWWMVVAPLVVMAFYSAMSLERATFIHSLLLCLFSCYYHATLQRSQGFRPARPSKFRRVAIATILLVVVVAVIYFPLKLRDPSLTPLGTLDSLLEYVSGPLGGLNTYVTQHPSVTPARPEFGVNTFWGAASVLLRLGVPLHLPPNWFEFVPYQAHGERLTNVYTWLLYFILDFGWFGVVAIPYLFGLIATALHYLVVVRGRRDLIAPLCILMVQLVMSFFAFSLGRDLRFWFVMLLAPFIERAALMRRSHTVRAYAAGPMPTRA